MAFCSKCGSTYAEGAAAFCPQCGSPLNAFAASAAPPASTSIPPLVAPSTTEGLKENVAGLLCYLLGWLTGIIFLLIDKRPFVRFHAAQSIVVFGFFSILRMVFVFAFLGHDFFSPWWILRGILSLVAFVTWIVLMIVAYQGKWAEVPVAAGIAKNIAVTARPL